jgi:hypothetical protein
LDVDLNAVSHHDEATDEEEPTSTTSVDVPVTFFLQTGNSFHTPSYFKVFGRSWLTILVLGQMVVINPFGLFSLLFSASSVIYKSYRQVQTPVDNLQRCLSLPIFDKTALVAFHKTMTQRYYSNRFLPIRENKSAQNLDSLHGIMKTLLTKHLPQTDDAKL